MQEIIKEPVWAMSNVFRDERNNVTYQLNTDPNRLGDPYFKLYNSKSVRSATLVARISFLSPEYVTHTDGLGKQPWILNSQERRMLVKTLTSKVRGDILWKRLIYTYNDEKEDLSRKNTNKLTRLVHSQLMGISSLSEFLEYYKEHGRDSAVSLVFSVLDIRTLEQATNVPSKYFADTMRCFHDALPIDLSMPDYLCLS